MKRLNQLAIIGILACSGAWAQTLSTIKIGLSMDGPAFFVDGRMFTSTQSFVWPAGSKHTLQFLLSYDAGTGAALTYQATNNDAVRYSFGGWATNGPALNPAGSTEQTITADPTITSILGSVTVSYRIHFQFYNSAPLENCGGAPNDPPQDGFRAGIIYADGTCLGDTTDIFMAAGQHVLNAFPYPGFVFTGWNIGGQQVTPYLTTFNVTASMQVIPLFMPGKRIHFVTNPPGLRVIVDRTLIQTPPQYSTFQLPGTNYDGQNCTPAYTRLPPGAPSGIVPLCVGDFDFLPGSLHQVGAPQTQTDEQGLYWVFTGYTNGLKQNDSYKTDTNVSTADTLVANFVPGIQVSLLTVPGNFPLEIDGQLSTQGPNYIWGAGEVHHVNAPTTQSSRNRKYQFAGWSNKGAQGQDITVPSDRVPVTLSASYQILGQVQVASTPAGLSATVDGTQCNTPCIVDRMAGTQIQVTVPATIPSTSLARYDFDGWSGGQTTATLSLTFNSDVQSVQAGYHTSFAVTTNSDPPGAVSFKFTPESPDGFYAQGTMVSVTAVPKPGFKFRRWGGDLVGTFDTGNLVVNAPRGVVALLDKVPFIAPAGVKNAAGDTPDGTIAPGSIVSIYGENLSSNLEVGRVNPLAQSLANVTVTVNDRLLPLLFVSPKQINAQVPSDLADGAYTVVVHNAGQPDVPGSFTVRRNSPGLFTQANDQGTPLALALHADGSPVTPDSPAHRREIVSLYGTGFGPYDTRVVDGFLVPSATLDRLTDPVAVLAGDSTFSPEWTGAAPGMVGMTIMKLKIADEMPQAATLDLAVSVNGVQSNKVQLPVE
jgi:uncharacterized protein (TIGR03437 family)